MTTEYDKYFRLYAAIFFDGLVSWPWFKAQGIAESSLNPDAVSPAGARGLMQIMPETAADIAKKLQVVPNLYEPKCNIMMGISYARDLWGIFKREHGLNRLRFALGAYNAGAGNIIRAQEATDRPDDWEAVSHALHTITGEKNAWQTINYVRRVESERLQIIEA